jgi:hypothetical protein
MVNEGLITASAKLRFLAGQQKNLPSEQNFGRMPIHELICVLLCFVVISEHLKWLMRDPRLVAVIRFA